MATLQLMCTGRQDSTLVNKPNFSLFSYVNMRHSNFATNYVEQNFTGSVRAGQSITCKINRCADMLNRIMIEADITCTGPTYYPLENMIQSIELNFSGNRVDRIDNNIFRIHDNLCRNADEKAAYYRMANFSKEEIEAASPTNPIRRKIMLPLIFFFNKDVALSLPLLLMYFHDVEIKIQFADRVKGIPSIEDTTIKIFAEYVLLSKEERLEYTSMSENKNKSYEMIITQWQIMGSEPANIPRSGVDKTENTSQVIRMNFSHPVKYLVWMLSGDNFGRYNNSHVSPIDEDDTAPLTDAGSLYNDIYAPLKNASIQFNGVDRCSIRDASYFNSEQPLQHFKANPEAGIYVYSFAERPGSHQPTGQANFSKIETVMLTLEYRKFKASASSAGAIPDYDTTVNNWNNLRSVNVYAHNINTLKFKLGLSGVAFAS